MPVLVVVALIVVPLVELYVLVQTGEVLGIVPTLLLLLGMSLLGGYLLRREGAKTWRALSGALQAGRLPAKEVADGALVILGGALLLTPGFVTDAVGLLCILPPSRALLRRMLTGVIARRLGLGGVVTLLGQDRGPARSDPTLHGDDVIDGHVVDDGESAPRVRSRDPRARNWVPRARSWPRRRGGPGSS